MSIFASVVASISASPIFASVPVQSAIAALGLTGATVTGQVLALGLIAFISVTALTFCTLMLVKAAVKVWNTKKDEESDDDQDPEMVSKLLVIKQAVTDYIDLVSEQIYFLKASKKDDVNKQYLVECKALLTELKTIDITTENEDLAALQAQKDAIDPKITAFSNRKEEVNLFGIAKFETLIQAQKNVLADCVDEELKAIGQQSIAVLEKKRANIPNIIIANLKARKADYWDLITQGQDNGNAHDSPEQLALQDKYAAIHNKLLKLEGKAPAAVVDKPAPAKKTSVLSDANVQKAIAKAKAKSRR